MEGLIGQTLKNRYRIYDQLGQGGAATVYLARDSETGQMTIVKVVHNHLVNDQFIARFEREIDLLQQINSGSIVKLYDWALQEFNAQLNYEISYIVAEFIEGHTLADIIDTRGKFDEPSALNITRQIAEGLADVHSRGIVHRDIKSQNIMVTPDNQAKIIDFGIAKAQNHATLTAPSHFAGTLHYAPPEQILESSEVDHRADIYALGIVLYEMLTATLPIKAREFGTVASKVISGDLDPITGVTEPVAELVNGMIAHRVDHRIASAREVIRQIDTILRGQVEIRTQEMTMAMAASQNRPVFALVTTTGFEIVLSKPDVVIGRSHPNDPNIPDIDLFAMNIEEARTASRRHCRVFTDGRDYFVEDMASMNGTRLNGTQLEAGVVYPLKLGDVIQAGRVSLTFSQRSN